MGITGTYLLPYPELTEPDDVPADMKQLADRLELVLPTFQARAEEGAANGYASLDASGKVPASQLPGAAGGGAIYRKTTEKDVTATSLTDLLNGEITIAAAAMSAGGRLMLRAAGDYMNNSGSNRNLVMALRLGALELWNSGNSNGIPSTSTSRRAWAIDVLIQALGTTTSQRASGRLVINTADLATTGTGQIRLPDTAQGPLHAAFLSVVGNVNMAAAQLLQLQAMHSGSGCSIRLEHAYIEVT